MADEIPSRGRRLPPISSKSSTTGTDKQDYELDKPRKKRVKKRTTTDSDNGPNPTSSDPTESVATKPKKKKRSAGSREALMSAGEAENGVAINSKKKKKKRSIEKRGPADGQEHGDVGLAAELKDIYDDVLQDEEEIIHSVWNAAPTMRSEPANKIFIESHGGFKTRDKNKLAQKRAEQQKKIDMPPPPTPDYNTMQVALGSHKIFKTGVLFLQGLFAGIAMWHIVAVWTLCNNGFDQFIDNYYQLALPVNCMYYFLFAVSTVAVFDRYDVGHPTRRLFVRCCTLQSGAVSCLFYLIGLVFSVSITNIDDRIGLQYEGVSTSDRDAELNRWLILNLMRGLMAILGWFIVSLRPNTDILTKNLSKDDTLFFEQFGDNVNSMEDITNA